MFNDACDSFATGFDAGATQRLTGTAEIVFGDLQIVVTLATRTISA